jgi:hypothetical protein
VNPNLAVKLLVRTAGGPEVIVVSGGVASIFQVRVAGVRSSWPSASFARTWNVCCPSARLVYFLGWEVQSEKGLPSRLHSKVIGDLSEVYVKVASFDFTVLPEGGAGGVLIKVSGLSTGTSTLNWALPGVQVILGSEEVPVQEPFIV